MEELIDYALAFSYQPVPGKPGLLIVTNAGGPGILAADAAGASGVKLADLQEDMKVELKSNLPPTASVANPVDILGDAKANRYSMVLEKAKASETVGGVLVLLTRQSTTQVEETAKVIAAFHKASKKPVLTSFMGKEGVASGLRLLQKSNIPNYPYPERAVFAFGKMYHYKSWQASPFSLPEAIDTDRDKASSLLSQARADNRSHLRPEEVFEVFSCYDIRIPKSLLARDAEQAIKQAKTIGFPVVLKIASPQITHKSDLGGVRIGLRDEEAVRLAFSEIMQNCSTAVPEASIEGVTVQEMVEKGKELIVGAYRDLLFGPVIMFGLGGIYVETLQDVSFRIAPLSMEDTTVMMREIRSFPIIAGIRGEEPYDVEAVQKAILRICRLMEDHPEIQEMDINPLKALTFGKGAIAIDGRITLIAESGEKTP
jgi:acyl-CoA synthetase (NDP forming)